MRIGRQGADRAVDQVRLLLAEAVEVLFGEHTFQEGAGIHARRCVTLEEDLVAAAGVVRAAEEVVHPDFVERGRRGIGGDVPTDADAGALCPVHHDRGVPADPAPVLPLHVLIPGEPWLALRRDGVDVVGRRERGDPHLLAAGLRQQLQHDVARAGAALPVDDSLQRLHPFLGLLGIGVGELARDAVEDGSGLA